MKMKKISSYAWILVQIQSRTHSLDKGKTSNEILLLQMRKSNFSIQTNLKEESPNLLQKKLKKIDCEHPFNICRCQLKKNIQVDLRITINNKFIISANITK